MSGCPMNRAVGVSAAVLAVVILAKSCRAFSGVASKSGRPSSSRVPPELRAISDKALLERLELAAELALQAGAAIKAVIHSPAKSVVMKGEIDLVTDTDKANEKMIFGAVRSRFPGDEFIGEESSSEFGVIADLTDRPTWIVDPVDGTTNFVHGFPMTTVSIGFARGGKMEMGAVYDPCLDELYLAVRGAGAFVNGVRACSSGRVRMGDSIVITEYGYQRDPKMIKVMMDTTEKVLSQSRAIRQVGSGCLDLCWVGCGRADAVYSGVAGEGWKPWDYAAGWLFAEEAGATLLQVDGSPFHLFSPSVLCAASTELAQELVSTLGF